MKATKKTPKATLNEVLTKLAAMKARAEGRKPYPPDDKKTPDLLAQYNRYLWSLMRNVAAVLIAFCISQYAVCATAQWWKESLSSSSNPDTTVWFVLIEVILCIFGSSWLAYRQAKKEHPGSYVENFYYAVKCELRLLKSPLAKPLVDSLWKAVKEQDPKDFSWQHWLSDRPGQSRFLYVPSYWERALKQIAKQIADDQLVGKPDVEVRRKKFSSLVALANNFLPGHNHPMAEKDLFPKSQAPVKA